MQLAVAAQGKISLPGGTEPGKGNDKMISQPVSGRNGKGKEQASPLSRLGEFLQLEASGGILLMFAAAAALILANSPLGEHYVRFQEIPGSVQVGDLTIAKPLLLWVNDLWMAVFFFLVGLEIKREFMEGELSSRAELLLPALAAAGGMVVPALVYVLLNWDSPATLGGWAIPAATDIAFALGILAMLGTRAPLSLKVLLTAIAIFDDLGAIVIIAAFYTADLSITSLWLAAAAIAGLVALNRLRVTHVAAYVIAGTILWVFVLKSGVHATLAGVVTALAVPLRVRDEEGHSLLRHLEHQLHPWVAFLILPTFAFANAGVSFAGLGLASLLEPVTLGIALGLLIGKQIGVFVPLWACIRLGLAPMPAGANWAQLYGVALLCGVGFTMSLFIGGLAFETASFAGPVRLGVLGGSVVAALGGYAVLRLAGSEER
jgi:Na+:H+ antiporter, NhaA family